MTSPRHHAALTGPVLVIANTGWNLANFREPVIRAFAAAGRRPVAVAAADGSEPRLEALGAEFRPIRIEAAGRSPLADLRLLLDLVALIRRERPTAVLTFTVKPNIYGLIAARLCRVRAIATVSGLGSSFLAGGPVGWLVSRLYRAAFRKAEAVMFQNKDDRDLFVDRRIVRPDQARLVAGSGVDLDRFRPAPLPGKSHVRFLFIGRILRDKGVVELAEAARLLRERGVGARIALLGATGADNPSAVPSDEFARWLQDGAIDYLGTSNDVRDSIMDADCVVLPSYREGLPRSLLEGAAMGRPLVASDVPGCRDLVTDEVNGFLCEARSAVSLADSIERMVAAGSAARRKMGAASRRLVEERYDSRAVASAYLEALGQ